MFDQLKCQKYHCISCSKFSRNEGWLAIIVEFHFVSKKVMEVFEMARWMEESDFKDCFGAI
jgi:hypothetical protein